jgi:polyisoprenoid-binding protein YceI
MKKIGTLLSIVAMLTFAACSSGPSGEKAEVGEAENIRPSMSDADNFTVDTAASIIHWEGTKPTGSHDGTIKILRGNLKIADGHILGGSMFIDMNTIENTDLADNEEYQQKLVAHLKSGDFFDVQKYPQAMFEIGNVSPISNPVKSEDGTLPTHRIEGNLTMKGIVKSVSFDAKLEFGPGQVYATVPQFVIDRTEWGIEYKSTKFFDDLKDQFINDGMGLGFRLKATKK